MIATTFHPNSLLVAETSHCMLRRDHAGAVPTLDDACFVTLERAFGEQHWSRQWQFWICVYDYLNEMRRGRIGP